MNIIYVRARIKEKWGIDMTVDQIITMMIEEGRITKKQGRMLKFQGYGYLYDDGPPLDKEDETLPLDRVYQNVV